MIAPLKSKVRSIVYGIVYGLGARARKVLGPVRRVGTSPLEPKQHFSTIYHANLFRGGESRSGEGSSIAQTETVRRELPGILRELGIQSFMDAPCGDFFWMSRTELPVERYIGVDIVPELIERNQVTFDATHREFLCRNLMQDLLPSTDLILCRDCLVHLTFKQALEVIENFQRSGSVYLLTTTFPARSKNVDLVGADIWRTLNLQKPPFDFPPPLRILNEKCTEGHGAFSDKSLGLWRLADLPVGSG